MQLLLIAAARAAGSLRFGGRIAANTLPFSYYDTHRSAAVAADTGASFPPAAVTFSTVGSRRHPSAAVAISAISVYSYASPPALPLHVALMPSLTWGMRSYGNFFSKEDVSRPSVDVYREGFVDTRRFYTQFRRVARLPLDTTLRQNLRCMQINHLTHVQDVTFFPILSGRDVVAVARSGTGKTLAYLVPLLQRLLNTGSFSMCGGGFPPPPRGGGAKTVSESMTHECRSSVEGRQGERVEAWQQHIGVDDQPPSLRNNVALLGVSSVGGGSPAAVILLPTRELCQQVASTALSLLPSLSVVVADSGTALQLQKQQLILGPVDIVVGTPSRCLLLHQRGDLQLQRLRCLVLDEADMLLSKGYADKVGLLLELSGCPGWTSTAQNTSPTKEESIRAGGHGNNAGNPSERSRLTKAKPDGGDATQNRGTNNDESAAAAAATERHAAGARGKTAGDGLNAGAPGVHGDAAGKYKSHVSSQDKEERDKWQQQVYMQKTNSALQLLLFSSLMPQEVMKIIKERLQDAVIFSLLKNKKGKSSSEASTLQGTYVEGEQ